MEYNRPSKRTVLATGVLGLAFVQRIILVLKHRSPDYSYYATSDGSDSFNIVRFK